MIECRHCHFKSKRDDYTTVRVGDYLMCSDTWGDALVEVFIACPKCHSPMSIQEEFISHDPNIINW